MTTRKRKGRMTVAPTRKRKRCDCGLCMDKDWCEENWCGPAEAYVKGELSLIAKNISVNGVNLRDVISTSKGCTVRLEVDSSGIVLNGERLNERQLRKLGLTTYLVDDWVVVLSDRLDVVCQEEANIRYDGEDENESRWSGMVLGGPSPPPAMRYYRLWIYTCNALLLVSVVGFAIVACRVLIFDPRRLLLPGLSLWQPSFLYAYLALIFQSGVLQVIGCLGASRLNERLLNIYWFLLLVLLVGDVLLGVVWMYRFDRLASDLRHGLRQSLLTRYGPDPEWTALWDAVQSQYSCCGVFGFQDFLPHNLSNQDNGALLPASCCGPRQTAVAAFRRDYHYAVSSSTPPLPAQTTPRPQVMAEPVRCAGGGLAYQDRCDVKLLAWLSQTAHLLFVLGYCVIAFIKLCFLGILRYEIREMIQKIKLVQESEGKAEGEGAKCAKQNNGTILQAVTQQNSIGREGVESPVGRKPGRKHLTTVVAADAGTDSDTNSHCALILCDGGEAGANGNNNYEMGELNRPRT